MKLTTPLRRAIVVVATSLAVAVGAAGAAEADTSGPPDPPPAADVPPGPVTGDEAATPPPTEPAADEEPAATTEPPSAVATTTPPTTTLPATPPPAPQPPATLPPTTTAPPAAIAATTVPPTTTTAPPPAAIVATTTLPAAIAATAPGSPAATPGPSRVTLTWLVPASNGGAAITHYVVQRSTTGTSGWTNAGYPSGTSFVASGLTNGVHYYFRVSAHNAAGFGPYSTVVGAVPRTVPTTPRSPTATPGNASVKLTWLAPSSNGGAAVDKYAVQRSTTGTSGWTNIAFPTGTFNYMVSNLTNGTPYSFRVVAHNAAGWSPASTVVSAVPRTVPSAVPACHASQASPGSYWIVLQWQAPYSNGGAPIESYWVEIWKNGAFYYGKETLDVASFLDAFAVASYGSYEVRVSARNDAGDGASCTTYVVMWP